MLRRDFFAERSHGKKPYAQNPACCMQEQKGKEDDGVGVSVADVNDFSRYRWAPDGRGRRLIRHAAV
jgi:hypothetical protein